MGNGRRGQEVNAEVVQAEVVQAEVVQAEVVQTGQTAVEETGTTIENVTLSTLEQLALDEQKAQADIDAAKTETPVEKSQYTSIAAYLEVLAADISETVDRASVVKELTLLTAKVARAVSSEQAPRRGQLAGKSLADMTADELKREKINADSVLYKAKERGASDETIAKNQARVDAYKVEMAKRAPVAVVAPVTPAESVVQSAEQIATESQEAALAAEL